MKAFEEACHQGADGIELDVQLTEDGCLLSFMIWIIEACWHRGKGFQKSQCRNPENSSGKNVQSFILWAPNTDLIEGVIL